MYTRTLFVPAGSHAACHDGLGTWGKAKDNPRTQQTRSHLLKPFLISCWPHHILYIDICCSPHTQMGSNDM